MTASELPHLRRLRLSGILDTLEVRTQQALPSSRIGVLFRRHAVGMRGAELPVHLPDQVGQVVVGADPLQQRRKLV